MKITGMTTWRLAFDATSWYRDAPLPKGEDRTWEYPLVRISTDEGIDGYTMGFGTIGESLSNAYLLHEVYWNDIKGEDPLRHEALWQALRRKNRHLYTFTDVYLGVLDVAFWDIKGKVAGLPIAMLLGLCREKMPSYASSSQF